MTDLFNLPITPYNGLSGHVGASSTSKARAVSEDRSGTTSHRQRQILGVLEGAPYGFTWNELGDELGLHHGQVSGALSVLHSAGLVFQLKKTRANCHLYVHADHRKKYTEAERIDTPVKTKSAQQTEALGQLLLAVDAFLYSQTFDTVKALRAARTRYTDFQ